MQSIHLATPNRQSLIVDLHCSHHVCGVSICVLQHAALQLENQPVHGYQRDTDHAREHISV